MRGPVPKSAQTRQRRNRTATSATLSLDENASNAVPKLPPREKRSEKWHPMAVEWWASVWRSPMASEYLDADMRGGLYLLAELQHQRWTCDDPAVLVNLAKEIRQQEVRFGLSPIDRRRLQWEVERAVDAVDRGQKRRAPKADPKKDPRDVLKAV